MEDNRPAFERRLGHIRLTIWENVTEAKANPNGETKAAKVWHNVSITRQYLHNDQWKESPTFNGLADLALVAECVQLARAWILAHEDRA